MIELDWTKLLVWVPAMADVATILGVPIALILYVTENRRRRLEREYGTYDALDEKYADYLRMVIENPGTDMFYSARTPVTARGEADLITRTAAFEILLGILERSFLMYSDQSSEIKKNQWIGWSNSIRTWIGHPDFASLWRQVGADFDARFVEFIDEELAKGAKAPVATD